MGEDIEQAGLPGVFSFREGANGGNSDGGDEVKQISDVDDDVVVPPNHFDTAPKRSTGADVAFIDDRADATRRGEGGDFSTKPLGKDERADDCNRVIYGNRNISKGKVLSDREWAKSSEY